MEIEYALACSRTNEAFDLGRGPWSVWRGQIPSSYDEVFAHVSDWLDGYSDADGEGPPTEQELAKRGQISKRIWAFISAHPGCHLIDDLSGDNQWWTPKLLETYPREVDPHIRVYVEVGSRYLDDAVFLPTVEVGWEQTVTLTAAPDSSFRWTGISEPSSETRELEVRELRHGLLLLYSPEVGVGGGPGLTLGELADKRRDLYAGRLVSGFKHVRPPYEPVTFYAGRLVSPNQLVVLNLYNPKPGAVRVEGLSLTGRFV